MRAGWLKIVSSGRSNRLQFAMRMRGMIVFFPAAALLCWSCFVPLEPAVRAQEKSTDAAAADPEAERERLAAERFLTVLEKNPRRGTALDRVYGYHIQWGTLDAFVKRYRDRVAKAPNDGTAWMLIGLVEAQRGKDAAAVEAFRQAEMHLPTNAIASYYLGLSLVLVGQPDAAADAFERAIVRKPAQADLLDIFQALGRVHQRAQHHEKALEVWNRLEKLFPDDQRVQEQIAATLVEEGRHEQALPRFETLAKSSTDAYRQSIYRMEAADIKVRLGKTPQALAGFEDLLGKLNPDNWLYREVRRRIEESFLRSDDQAGLAKYYDGWIEKHKDDVDAMARLASILAAQGRIPEAQDRLEKALKLAPSRKELRRALIEQLLSDQRYADAAVQYAVLDKSDPNNPDVLRDWGRVFLKDTSKREPQRQQEAAA